MLTAAQSASTVLGIELDGVFLGIREMLVAEKPWGGVFQQATDRRVEEFTESVSFDRRLYAHDIDGSIAHAQMLAKVGLIAADECQQIEQALGEIRQEIEQGRFPFRVELEDIHMHIERALIERIGDVGRKLHTARSRNDQVATDLRLWVREAIDQLDQRLVDLQRAFVGRCDARRRRDPARLHPPAAAPSRCWPPHYWLAYCEKFERDRGAAGRLPAADERAAAWARRPWPARACRSTATTSPPGSDSTSVAANSLDAVERPRLRPGVRLRAGADRRAPEHLGRGVDPLVDRRVRLPEAARRRSAPARRSCRRRSTPTCWS